MPASSGRTPATETRYDRTVDQAGKGLLGFKGGDRGSSEGRRVAAGPVEKVDGNVQLRATEEPSLLLSVNNWCVRNMFRLSTGHDAYTPCRWW